MKGRRSQPRAAAEQTSLGDLLGYRFTNRSLLRLALTHRSEAHESHSNPDGDPSLDNEQLEFVGDAVLGLVTAESLYKRFPKANEGELTRLRAAIVSREHLAKAATRVNLGAALHLGRGEERSGGRTKPALLANALEAVIAALYLDGGLESSRSFVEAHVIEPAMPSLRQALGQTDAFNGAIGDHKSALQEHLQGIGAGQPQYVLTSQSGPDHRKLFRIEVRVDTGATGLRTLADSEGSTKKQAQQEAARLALQRLLVEAEVSGRAAADNLRERVAG